MRIGKELLDFLRFSPDILTSYSEEYGLYTFKYKHSGVDFTKPEIRLARGLTMTPEGKVVLAGYEKFFNYRQLEGREGLTEDFINEFCSYDFEGDIPDGFREKLDGSLILLGVHNGELIAGTSSGFSSWQSQEATEHFQNVELKDEIKEYIELYNATLLFEYVSPKNQVVIPYESERYVLLDIIWNDSLRRCDRTHTKSIAKEFGFPSPRVFYATKEEMLKVMKERKDIEGFIGYNKYGRLIKFKTDEWFQLSRSYSILFTNQINEAFIKEVVKNYCNETLDDWEALCNQAGKSILRSFTEEIVATIEEIQEEIDRYQVEYAGIHEDPSVRKALGLRKDICGFVKNVLWTKNHSKNQYEERLCKEIIRRRKLREEKSM